jgi:uncharacterized protein YceK
MENLALSRFVTLLVSAAVFSLNGCGTFSDAMCGPCGPGYDYAYYRGVRFDALAVKQGGLVMAADMPFSAFADTVLVPFIACNELTQGSKGSKREQPFWKDEQVQSEPISPVSNSKQSTISLQSSR